MHSLSSDVARPPRNKLTLWLVLAVCAAPVIASYVAYYVWQPSAHVNYGELLEPHPLPDAALKTIDAHPFRWSELKGDWVLLTIDDSICNARCRTNLVYTRQVRLAQGKDSERIERVWLLTDQAAPDSRLISEHPGLRIVRADEATLAKVLPVADAPRGRIYVVDPLGNLMMRFPADPDPRRMLKDVARLLRHSNWK